MQRERALYALLIGIDDYRPVRRSLYGCVRDVRRFTTFFLGRLRQMEKQIYPLIAPHPGSDEDEPAILQHQQPTYENIVRTFQQVTAQAEAGDLVWIYFAGHGARVRTAYPEAKGSSGIDEVLVLWQPEGRAPKHYLRDIELGYLLQAMVQKGLIVTLVLDCCHAGGATRGNEQALIRGIGYIDTPALATSSLVASSQALSENWQALQKEQTRGFAICSGWLPQAQGYVFLAACRDIEQARESQLSGSRPGGIFTNFLLETLWQMPPESTYRMVYHRVRAKVHAHFGGQTPQLEGEHDRVIFSSSCLTRMYTAAVLAVRPCEDQRASLLELDADRLHTLQEGARFWIYPNPVRVSKPVEAEQCLASIEISELDVGRSRALISPEEARCSEGGDQAVLITAGPWRLSHRVRLLHQPSLLSTSDVQQPLREIAALIKQYRGAFLRLADPDEEADFLPAAEYEIQDADGFPIPNLRPTLSLTTTNAPRVLVERLVHLAKYRNVLRLENQSGLSSIVDKLHAQVHRPQDTEQTRWKSEAGSSLLLEPGEKIDLAITNCSSQRMYVAVLDLASDWSIQQLYPQSNTDLLGPQKTETISLVAERAASCSEGIDTLKVFAALDVTDFHGLNLPALDQPPLPNRARGDLPRTALGELLEAFYADAPLPRGFRVMRKAEWEWTCLSIGVSIRWG